MKSEEITLEVTEAQLADFPDVPDATLPSSFNEQ